MLARSRPPIAAIASMTVVESRGNRDPAGGGTSGGEIVGGVGSMGACSFRFRGLGPLHLLVPMDCPGPRRRHGVDRPQLLTGFPHSGQNFMFPGTSCPSGQGGVCGAPHSPQNLSPGGTGLPHLTHGLLPAATVVSAPQFPQNFTFTGFIVPHFGQALCWDPCCCCPCIMPGN